MKNYRDAVKLVCAVALAAVSVACSNTAEGVKRDTDELKDDAARTATEAKREAGDMTDAAADAAGRAGDRAAGVIENAGRAGDAAMETFDVKVALVADSRIDAGDINVDTDHTTKTVVLKGSVPNDAQRTLAGQIASEKAVGYRVENRLVVAES